MAQYTHTYVWHLSPTLRAAGTPYQVLGVARDATPEDIRRAGRKAELSAHPDKGGSTEEFDLVRLAKRVLENSESRERYDDRGEFLDMGPGAHEQEVPSCRHLHPHPHPHPHTHLHLHLHPQPHPHPQLTLMRKEPPTDDNNDTDEATDEGVDTDEPGGEVNIILFEK